MNKLYLISFLCLFYGIEAFAEKKPKTVRTPISLSPALPADIFVKLAKLINPAVVNISTTKILPQNPMLDLFFGIPTPPEDKQPAHSLGTGFILKPDGLIATNTHVIDRVDSIRVQLMNSPDFYTAKVVGKDNFTDVALLKITVKNKKLPTVRMGNSRDLEVGEWVAAFGNPYGHGHTMTKGIISARNRVINDLNLFPFLQTDADINPGNSGGPLVNMKGEVIGINTATNIRAQGISFAIPIDNARAVMEDLLKYGRVRRGFIGVQMETSHDKKGGALIVNVFPNTPAEKAKIKPFDIVTRFNGQAVKNHIDLFRYVALAPVNKKTDITVKRKDKTLNLKITVQERTPVLAQKPTSQQKTAPFDLGLSVAEGTRQTLLAMGLPPLNRTHPVVTKVKPGSPSALARIRKKDIILKVNGQFVSNSKQMSKALSRHKNTLHILRYRPYSNYYVNIRIQLNTR